MNWLNDDFGTKASWKDGLRMEKSDLLDRALEVEDGDVVEETDGERQGLHFVGRHRGAMVRTANEKDELKILLCYTRAMHLEEMEKQYWIRWPCIASMYESHLIFGRC